MKYKQNMLDLLEEIKDSVLALEAQAEDIDRISGLIDKAKDYFDDYAFETVEDVQEILSTEVIGIVPEDTGIITSTNKGEPIVNDETALAGQAYQNIARRILGEEVPFLDIDVPQDFVSKVVRFFKGLFGKE